MEQYDDEGMEEGLPQTKQGKTALDQTHKLSPLQKRLKKITDKAIAKLESVLENPEASIKEQMDAAKTLTSMYIDVTKELNNDSLKKTLIQLKLSGAMNQREKAIEGETFSAPIFMPDTIVDDGLVEKGGRSSIEAEVDLSGYDVKH